MSEQETDSQESVWAWLANAWVLRYLLPGLVGLSIAMYSLSQKEAQQEKKREVQVEAYRKDLLERAERGEAHDIELQLMGIDKETREKYQQLHSKKKSKQ
jgi:hypothetical protein